MAAGQAAEAVPIAAVTIRERGLHERRLRILVAAEALIRETGSTDFTVATLAARAGLSGPTPYNLFGSKAAILYALLNRSLDLVFAGKTKIDAKLDPVARVLAAASLGADVFTGDPAFYRPIYQFLLGVDDAVHRPAFLERSMQYWRHALEPLIDSGQVPLAHRGDRLARMMVLNFMAALEFWVHLELDHGQFRAQVLYGTALLLLGFATGRQREVLLRQIRSLERRLPRSFARPHSPGGGATAN